MMNARRQHATTVVPDATAVREARGAKSWSQEKLAEKSGVSVSKISQIERGVSASRETVALLAQCLEVNEERLLRQAEPDQEPIKTEIERFLARNNIRRDFDGQFIEVFSSPEARGWKRGEVSHKVVGDYPCPIEFRKLMERFKADPPIREYFGLHKCPALTFADEQKPVEFELYRGTWQHVSTLTRIFRNRFSDTECRKFRFDFENQWIQYSEAAPLMSSPLYHHVNAEVLVLSSDHRLVLGKRHEDMLWGGAWSATLEEQMLRRDPEKPKRRDIHIFDAAERGAREELGVTIRPDDTTLIKVGVEWGNFTAAFIFLVRCEESFKQIVERWNRVVHDPNEAVALDSIKATPEAISETLKLKSYSPTKLWVRRVAVNKMEGDWHPTAIARLRALKQHLEYLNE
jgi:transcriptional regulator with XRE-family HTH domain